MNQYKKGEIVTGCVTGIEKYGIFVSLDEYYSGLIHISEISDFFVKNPSDYVYVGETIKALVIDDSDLDSYHVKLSIKNIDYKFTKKKRKKIIETTSGFKTLQEALPGWIETKKEEILSTMKKN
ncbi:MAG: S1 RNA-binding domain-containing protein [bacterium]|nr:S1 RNA-binding domain-containing protein [Mycoplasmatota bacterium]MDD6757702.1 S1 RNA-binding domain-containing protein [bacterium]MDY2907778.1 S1 RNA-binding domain-containing protein [Candidatus Faecimonas sp.]